jgi:predicted RecA/RadA family phage recombinase
VYYVEEENLWPGAVAKYWKNDSLVQLTDNSLGASAESIAVSGNNVYVAGTGREGSDADPVGIAKYWKNGIPNNLTDGSTSAYASSIAISGNDVYVLGVQYDGAPYGQGYRYGVIKFWKNGTVVRVTDGSADATGAAIAVSGNDVYIAGTEYDGIIVNGFHRGVAKYWKNGVPVVLTDGSAHAVAESIAVNGSDVYVAGTTNLDPISF